MRILFLTPRFPWPLIGGDRIKPYYMLSHLAKKHDVTLVTFYQGRNRLPEKYIGELTSKGIEVHVIEIDPVKAGLRTAVLSLFTKFPFEISFYNNPDFGFTVEKLLKNKSFDLAFAFFMRTAEYLKNLKIKKILVAEDCRTLYQRRSYEESSNLKQRFIRKCETNRLLKYEPEIMNFFDTATFVTLEDISKITEMNPAPRYRHLTNGVNLDIFTFPANQKRSGILFAGKLDIWANYLMVERIITQIFPLIRERYPSATLKIAGAKPTKYIKSVISSPVTLDPDVPSMVPYLHNSGVFLHPHSGGTGIQNKLLEAMACGCPVVTTSTGIQGIPAVHGSDVMIGNTSEEMAEYTTMILEDNSLAESLSRNARELIEKQFSWDSVLKKLDSLIEEVMEREI